MPLNFSMAEKMCLSENSTSRKLLSTNLNLPIFLVMGPK